MNSLCYNKVEREMVGLSLVDQDVMAQLTPLTNEQYSTRIDNMVNKAGISHDDVVRAHGNCGYVNSKDDTNNMVYIHETPVARFTKEYLDMLESSIYVNIETDKEDAEELFDTAMAKKNDRSWSKMLINPTEQEQGNSFDGDYQTMFDWICDHHEDLKELLDALDLDAPLDDVVLSLDAPDPVELTEPEEPEVNIVLLNVIDPDDVEQICCDADIDIEIDKDGTYPTVTHCDNPQFLNGVIAALMHGDQ